MLQRVEITGWYSVHSFFEHRTHYSFGIGELRVRRYRAGLLVTGLVGFFIRYSYLRITIEGEGKKVYQFRFFHAPLCVLFYVLPRTLPVFHDRDRFLLIRDSTRLRNYRTYEGANYFTTLRANTRTLYRCTFFSFYRVIHAYTQSVYKRSFKRGKFEELGSIRSFGVRVNALYIFETRAYVADILVKSSKVRSSKLLTVGRNFLLVY